MRCWRELSNISSMGTLLPFKEMLIETINTVTHPRVSLKPISKSSVSVQTYNSVFLAAIVWCLNLLCWSIRSTATVPVHNR